MRERPITIGRLQIDTKRPKLSHTLVAGDDPYLIAQANSIDMATLARLNPQIADWHNLPVGTVINLVEKVKPRKLSHTLVAGDDPYIIAQENGTNMSTLANLNPQIIDWHNLPAGTVINLASVEEEQIPPATEKIEALPPEISAVVDTTTPQETPRAQVSPTYIPRIPRQIHRDAILARQRDKTVSGMPAHTLPITTLLKSRIAFERKKASDQETKTASQQILSADERARQAIPEQKRKDALAEDRESHPFKWFVIDGMSEDAFKLIFIRGKEEMFLENIDKICGEVVCGKDSREVAFSNPGRDGIVYMSSNGFTLRKSNKKEKFILSFPKGKNLPNLLSYESGKNLLETMAKKKQEKLWEDFGESKKQFHTLKKT